MINRIESRVTFASEAFIHEIEYGAKAGEAKFVAKANMF